MRIHLWCAASLALALTACSGDNGAAGMDGDSGEPGEPGAKGDDGANGDPGAKGAPGAKGDDGATGAKGDTGDDGAKGDKGDTGDTGATGADGNDIILSETARLGLEISPVPVDTAGLDGDEVESVGRGAYLVNAVADCVGCHNGQDNQGNPLFLAGNVDFALGGLTAAGAPCTVGTAGCTDSHVYTRNLTPDKTTGLKLKEDDFVFALRTGMDFKDATGATSLIVMPWQQLRWLTDRDLRDMYHYLKHIPAIENAVQGDKKPKFPPSLAPFYGADRDHPIDVPAFADTDASAFVARPLPAALDMSLNPPRPTAAVGEVFDTNNVLRGLAISPLKDDVVVAGLSATDQALYGRGSYIVNGPGLCNECHTAGGRNQPSGTVRSATFLAGGQAFAVLPQLRPILGQVRSMSANLTGDNAGFQLAFSMFLDTWLSGLSFSKGTPHVLGFPMPFDIFRNMTNADKEAVYTYITTIQKAGLVTGDIAHQAPARFCETATAATDCPGSGETCEAISVFDTDDTHECAGAACSDATNATDCGACQTCVAGKCVKEDSSSACVTTSL